MVEQEDATQLSEVEADEQPVEDLEQHDRILLASVGEE